MGLIVVTSTGGAAGATTTALAVAGAWPGERPVVVEADVSGGDVAAWWGIPPQPGLVDAAMRVRAGAEPGDALGGAARVLPPEAGGVRVVCAPVTPAGTGTLELIDPYRIAGAGLPVVADVGVWRPDGPADAWCGAGQVVVVCLPATVAGVLRARAILTGPARAWPGRVVAACGPGPVTHPEVAAALACPVTFVPRDSYSAGLVAGRVAAQPWRPRRAARAWRDLACRVAARGAPEAITATPEPAPEPASASVAESVGRAGGRV